MAYKRLIFISTLVIFMLSVSIYRSLAFNGEFEHLSGPKAPFAIEMTNSDSEQIVVVNNKVVEKFSGLFSMDDNSFLARKERSFLTSINQKALDFQLTKKYIVKWNAYTPTPTGDEQYEQTVTILNRQTKKERAITLPFVNCSISGVAIDDDQMVLLASFRVPKPDQDETQSHAITFNLLTGTLQTKKAPSNVLSNLSLVNDTLYGYDFDQNIIYRFSLENQKWEIALDFPLTSYINVALSRHYAIYSDLKNTYVYDLQQSKLVRKMKLNGNFETATISDKYIEIVTSEEYDNRMILTLYPLDKTKEKSVYRTPYGARVSHFFK